MNATNQKMYSEIKDPVKAEEFKLGCEILERGNADYLEMKEAMALMAGALEDKHVDYLGGQK